jgi:hypothetical protein
VRCLSIDLVVVYFNVNYDVWERVRVMVESSGLDERNIRAQPRRRIKRSKSLFYIKSSGNARLLGIGNDARQSDYLHTAEIGTDKSKADEKRAFRPCRQHVYYDSNYLKLQGYTAGSGHQIQPGAQAVH